jgi:hypothetical protein
MFLKKATNKITPLDHGYPLVKDSVQLVDFSIGSSAPPSHSGKRETKQIGEFNVEDEDETLQDFYVDLYVIYSLLLSTLIHSYFLKEIDINYETKLLAFARICRVNGKDTPTGS